MVLFKYFEMGRRLMQRWNKDQKINMRFKMIVIIRRIEQYISEVTNWDIDRFRNGTKAKN